MIALFPKSGFEVVHPSADQLVVLAHVQYLWLVIPVAVFAIGAAFIFNALKKSGGGSGVWTGLFLIAVAIMVASTLIAHGQAVFDKQAGTVTFDRTGMWFRTRHLTFPIADVSHATVRTMGGGSFHFVVVFKSGGSEDIVASSSAGGQYQAAAAVNQFLATKGE
jgi:hypothetical protein